MQVEKTENSPTELILTISAGASELNPIKEHVLGHFVKNVKVPGFRIGKAPLNMVEKHIDQQQLFNEFLDHAINDLYGKTLDEQNIRAAGMPEISVTKFVPFTDLSFKATVPTIGKISLSDYKKNKITQNPVIVLDEDVDEVIKNLRLRSATKIDVDRTSKLTDQVWIDFDGSDEKGDPIAGSSGKDYPLVLGSNTFIPGFEPELIGLKAGDIKKFDIIFPNNYGVANLRNKKVTFNTTVNKVQEVKEPKLDTAFAASVGPFKSIAELKADILKQLKAEKQLQTRRELENEIIKNIAESSKVEIPTSLVDQQILRLEEDEKRNLTYQGQTWQEHLDAEAQTEQEHRDSKRPDALLRVKAGLVLSEISVKEGIEVSPEELEVRIKLLKDQQRDPKLKNDLDKPESRRDVAAQILTEKTIAKLLEYNSN